MKERADDEDDERADQSAEATLNHQWLIDMSLAEIVHDGIPSIPELVQIGGIPPIAIEEPIAEAEQFGHEIQSRVKVNVEEQQPDQMIRHGQTKKSLHVFENGVLTHGPIERSQYGQDPLLAEAVLQRADDEYLCEASAKEALANARRTWKVQFVAECRCKDEIVQVLHREIMRIGHGTVAWNGRMRTVVLLVLDEILTIAIVDVRVGDELEEDDRVQRDGNERASRIRLTVVDVASGKHEYTNEIDALKGEPTVFR